MPAATTILAATALATSTGMGINQAIQGKKQAEKAEAAIEGYQREELRNVYAGVTLPTQRTRLETEAVKESVAGATQSLSKAGARGLVGGLPQVQDFSAEAIAKIGANLEESMFRIQTLIAEDEKRIQSETTRREEQDIAGLGSLYEAGRQEQALGLSSIPRGIGSAATILGATDPSGDTQSVARDTDIINPLESIQAPAVNTYTQGGLAPMNTGGI